jgi:hypothetical protein
MEAGSAAVVSTVGALEVASTAAGLEAVFAVAASEDSPAGISQVAASAALAVWGTVLWVRLRVRAESEEPGFVQAE